jgi:hypothetical protein
MTIVIAKRFGDRIVIQSDTAISNDQSRSNAIPGRLKAVVLSPMLSVAFAGAADRADWVIRGLPIVLRKNGLQGVLTWLVDNTQATGAAWDDSVSYIVASHMNGAALYRVWDGRCSDPLSHAWIGDKSAYNAFLTAECEVTKKDSRGHPVGNEHRFTIAFNELFYSSRHGADFVLRGFCINLLASPWGHCYQRTAVSFNPGPILIGSEAAKGDSAWLKSLGLWTCNIYESRYCGVGVLGALLPQGGISFIYAPILDRNAARFPLRPASLDWNDYRPQMTAKLLSELDRVAKVVGGGIIID